MSFELTKVEMTEKEFQEKSEAMGEVLDVFQDENSEPEDEGIVDPELEAKKGKSKTRQKAKTTKKNQNKKTATIENGSEGDLVRQTYIVTEDLKWALKRKAAYEKKGVNVVLRELLESGIEGRYFD